MRKPTIVLVVLVATSCSSTVGGGGSAGGGGDVAATTTSSTTGMTGTAGDGNASVGTGSGGDGGAGGNTGGGSSTSMTGSGGEGGRREPTGEECLGITNRDDCEAAGCLIGWAGVHLMTVVDGRCAYEYSVGRCLHATSLYTPGGATSAWWRETEFGVEVFEASSYCDYLGIQPCLGLRDDTYPGEPEACRCAMSDQMCAPFPDGYP